MNDYFAVFGLPRKLQLDPEELRRRFYELSRVHHPDFHQGASEEDQAKALSASALLNRAYRALRDPVSGSSTSSRWRTVARPGKGGREAQGAEDLLEEIMEVQEAPEAKLEDEVSRQRLSEERQRLRARQPAEEDAIAARAAEWDAGVVGPRPHGADRVVQAAARRSGRTCAP